MQFINMGSVQRELAQYFEWHINNSDENFFCKLNYFSGLFLGRPYIGGALGEGDNGEFDQNPLYRTDGFDCLTYVNTVFALLMSFSLPEFIFHLTKLNYRGGNVSYQNRHHFMSSDWNIANSDAGYISDVTNSIVNRVGAPIFDVARACINKPNWILHRGFDDLKFCVLLSSDEIKKKLKKMHALAKNFECVDAYISYIPLKCLFDINGRVDDFLIGQFPDSAIIEVVRPNWDLTQQIGTHLNVSHLGFLLRVDGDLILRHASQVVKKVIEEPLVNYLRRYLDSPTIKGVNLQIMTNNYK